MTVNNSGTSETYDEWGKSNLNAAELAFHTDNAQSPMGLRSAYDRAGRDRLFTDVDYRHLGFLTKTVANKLTSLGLDLNNDGDDRITRFNRAVDYAGESQNYTLSRLNVTGQPGYPFLAAYHRLLSAIDISSESGLRLLPQESLRPVKLVQSMAAFMMHFAANQNPEVPMGLLNQRYQVKDSKSPYWGSTIDVDDRTGRSFGAMGSGPNVTIRIPTGVIQAEAVRGLSDFATEQSQTCQVMYERAGYVPDVITAQVLHLGAPLSSHEQVDTTNHYVANLLTYAAAS